MTDEIVNFTGIDAELIQEFSPNSQLWIYQVNRDKDLTAAEIISIQKQVSEFAKQWQVHGSPATAYGDFLFGKFILFVVSEATPASGCSIDSSVQFIKQLGQQFGVDFFDRSQIAFVLPESGEIQSRSLSTIKSDLQSGALTKKAYFFNNSITTLSQLDGEWLIAFEDSWLNR